MTAPPGAVIITWTGTNHTAQRSTGDPLEISYLDVDANGHASGIAIFTRRGDMHANGWLEPYQCCAE